MPQCEHCGKEVDFPFRCNFCGHYYCIEHRLPENHNCYGAPPRTPLGSYQTKRMYATINVEKTQIIPKYATKESGKPKTKTYGNIYGYHFEVPVEVYSDERYRMKLDKAKTLDEVEHIIDEYYYEHSEEKVERLKTEKHFPAKKIAALILLGILIVSVIFYAPTILHYFWNPSEKESGDQTTTTPKYTTSIYFEGFSLTQNGTHLIIEDYSSEWAPYYHISLKNGTRVLGLVAYEAEGSNAVAEYAFITKRFAKEIYNLKDIFDHLPSGQYIFEIYSQDRKYSIVIDSESQKILFGNYSKVFYFGISLGETIYDVVLENFNETVFQRIREYVFNNSSDNGNTFDMIQHLVEWADKNIEYAFIKLRSDIYDPLTFMEKKEGVCIDYAVFYASGLFTIGFNETYIFILNTTEGLHAVAGVEYNNSILILEQTLPVWEFQDYIDNLEAIIGASIQPPIHAYKITCKDNDFTIEFFNPFTFSSANLSFP